jgi:PTS system N-acetylgalactosamine-specific IIA component
MLSIIVMGHGGYAAGIKSNLCMLLGEPKNMYFLDLEREDSLADLEMRLNDLLSTLGEDSILFACDLLGASPFRLAAIHSATHIGKSFTVTGLNTMAYLELGLSNDLNIVEMIDRVIETAKNAITKYPE